MNYIDRNKDVVFGYKEEIKNDILTNININIAFI
jgi:hypothetical protein